MELQVCNVSEAMPPLPVPSFQFLPAPFQSQPLPLPLSPSQEWSWIWSWSVWSTWAGILAAYMMLCSMLRFRFEKAMLKKFNYPDRASLARMTNDDAQAILQYLITQEFPAFYKLGLQLGLFKTTGIPTISKLLYSLKSFSPATGSKRYEDTAVIFGVFSLYPPTDPRAIKAISRMNYLHGGYRASGHITNPDMLYTLSTCIRDVTRFIDLYEWRRLNDMERCAIGTFWKSIGDAMQIEYTGLLSKTEWVDGIEFAEDISEWSRQFEMDKMVPAETNGPPSRALLDMMTFHVPMRLKPFADEVLAVLMGDRVRDAFFIAEPGIFAGLVAFGALNLRKIYLRYFALPRFAPVELFDEDKKTGRMHHYEYLVDPWYHKATFWSQWGPMGLLTRVLGGKVPGTEARTRPEGFLFEELGPAQKMWKGKDVTDSHEKRLGEERMSGCPFASRT